MIIQFNFFKKMKKINFKRKNNWYFTQSGTDTFSKGTIVNQTDASRDGD